MTVAIYAPLTGILCPIAEVPDPVFAQKLVGDGLAIEPLSNRLTAPFDGEVIALAPTGHSVTLRSNDGIDLLIHVGIDTVSLGGKGFTQLAAVGDRVARGDALIGIDLDLVAAGAPSLVTPIIVTTPGAAIHIRAAAGPVAAGELLFEVERLADADGRHAVGTQSTAHMLATLPGGHGIHARPAARISALARGFDGDVRIGCNGRTADAKSVTALLTLGAVAGDQLDIRVVGPEPRAFAVQLAQLISESEAPDDGGDAETQSNDSNDAAQPLAPGQFRAVRAAPGLAMGPVFSVRAEDAAIDERGGDPAEERQRLAIARERLKRGLGARAAGPEAAAAAIASAHIALLDDSALGERVDALIAGGATASFAWRAVSRQEEEALRGTGVPRLAERAIDLRDIERQLLGELAGGAPDSQGTGAPQGAIVVADDLPPSFLLDPANARIGGIVLRGGGATSHLAILAAAAAIPMLVAAGDATATLSEGAIVILDADRHLVETAPDKARIAAVDTELTARAARAASALEW